MPAAQAAVMALDALLSWAALREDMTKSLS